MIGIFLDFSITLCFDSLFCLFTFIFGENFVLFVHEILWVKWNFDKQVLFRFVSFRFVFVFGFF